MEKYEAYKLPPRSSGSDWQGAYSSVGSLVLGRVEVGMEKLTNDTYFLGLTCLEWEGGQVLGEGVIILSGHDG